MRGGYALLILVAAAAPLQAQRYDDRDGGSGISARRAVDAAILSDVSRDRRAERDDRQTPYASPGHGPIATAREARDACATEALGEAGQPSRLVGVPIARTMATGWEVEGAIDAGPERIGFVCSVRNGSVSGVTLR